MTHEQIAMLRALKARIDAEATNAEDAETTTLGGTQHATYWRGQRDGLRIAIAMVQDALDGKVP